MHIYIPIKNVHILHKGLAENGCKNDFYIEGTALEGFNNHERLP